MAETVGELLRRLRKQAGLTQEELEARAKVSVSTIRRIENDKPFDHRLGTVASLADVLGASPEDRRRLAAALGGATDAPGGADRQPSDGTPPDMPAAQVPATRSPGPSAAPDTTRGPLAEAADELAREIRRRWQHEEAQRRVHHPYPLPVRWRQVPSGLADHVENSRSHTLAEAVPEADMSGALPEVAEMYGKVGSGRLVILGRAGSGKSVLAIRFVLDLLAERARGQGSRRVPVIFGVGSWDPTAVGLRDWLVDGLLRDHPHLARRVPSGKTLAADLIDAGFILPVLDGFDEIAEGLRSDALDALNRVSTPLVLTSRHGEFAQAVRAAHAPLASAVGIELGDLTLDDLREYLPLTAPVLPDEAGQADSGGSETTWDAVLDEARGGGAGGAHIAAALSTPLMVALARTMYSDSPDHTPDELLDTALFPDAHAIEEHLLAGFLPAVYRRGAPDRLDDSPRGVPQDPGQAQKWLSHLAHHLVRFDHERQDLAWWQLGDSLPWPTRVLAVALASALCVAVSTWCAGLAALPFLGSSPAVLTPAQVLIEGVLVGLAGGLAFGVTYAVVAARSGSQSFEPTTVRLRLPGASGGMGRRSLRETSAYLGAVLAGGVVMGVGMALVTTLQYHLFFHAPLATSPMLHVTLTNMLVYALIFGPAACLVFGLVVALEAPLDVTTSATPQGLLSSNRATAGRRALVLAPMLTLTVALGGYVVVFLLHGALGPLAWSLSDALPIAAAGGLGGTAAYMLAFTAWGQWILLARIWLPLTGRLPRDTLAFLDDAYRRGVLRRRGAVHQFRHLRLQHHLARSYREEHGEYRSANLTPPPMTSPDRRAP
ncbi:helix-turn-helix domain-containing protein [Streptomyces sp. NPDC127190]|uniref:helix-turn-helix domain-containing protein n=1 Tax=unclassified Streptomyces TaxID=2593676 RepID=UPI00362CF202